VGIGNGQIIHALWRGDNHNGLNHAGRAICFLHCIAGSQLTSLNPASCDFTLTQPGRACHHIERVIRGGLDYFTVDGQLDNRGINMRKRGGDEVVVSCVRQLIPSKNTVAYIDIFDGDRAFVGDNGCLFTEAVDMTGITHPADNPGQVVTMAGEGIHRVHAMPQAAAADARNWDHADERHQPLPAGEILAGDDVVTRNCRHQVIEIADHRCITNGEAEDQRRGADRCRLVGIGREEDVVETLRAPCERVVHIRTQVVDQCMHISTLIVIETLQHICKPHAHGVEIAQQFQIIVKE